jgi:hypothetical protein
MSDFVAWIVGAVVGAIGMTIAKALLSKSSFMAGKENRTIWIWVMAVMIGLAITLIVAGLYTLFSGEGYYAEDVEIGTVYNAEDARQREALLVASYGGRLSPKVLEQFKIRANRASMTWELLQEHAEAYAQAGWVVQDHALDGIPLWYVGHPNWAHASQWSNIRAHDMWYGETADTAGAPMKDVCWIKGAGKLELAKSVKEGYIDRPDGYDWGKVTLQIEGKANKFASTQPDGCYVPHLNSTWWSGELLPGNLHSQPIEVPFPPGGPMVCMTNPAFCVQWQQDWIANNPA